ncbi:MAG: TRASH domain-containing protein [Desulfobulbaceae bacterium]|nr:TRASH domain-containing protein [Desulfobulbaceae bacterium]
MKEPLEEKVDLLHSRQNGWYRHLANCIASEKCPYCGEDIFVNEEIMEKTSRKAYFFECSACPWKNS